MIITETERLVFRQFTHRDIDDLFCLLSDPIVMKFCSGPLTLADSQRWLATAIACYEKFGYDYWAVNEKNTGDFVGQMGILKQDIDDKQVECLAFMLNQKYWNKGYASEGAMACIRYAFISLKLENIVATVEPGNSQSISVLRKIGMKHHEEKIYTGRRVHVYSICKNDVEDANDGGKLL